MPLLKPIVERSKNRREWLFSSDFPTTMSYYFELRRQTHSQIQSISPEIHEATTTRFATRLKIQFLKTFGFDGLNTTTNTITCANGRVEAYTSGILPLRFVITSLLGMPNRPDNVVYGVPQLSLIQFLLNWVGGFTISRDRIDNKIQYPLRTAIQFLAIVPFKIVILLFKIATFPLKTLLNAVKLITEFALPLISFYTAVLNIKMVEGIVWLGKKAVEKDTHYVQLSGGGKSSEDIRSTVTSSSAWKIGLFSFGIIPMAVAVLSVWIIQYATVWACRAGRALTSPAESARRAYALGRSLQIGKEGSKTRSVISYAMGILGALVSLGVTAILWTLALPLALSTVTTWIPSLINAVNWIAQLPAVSATLTWISSTSLATGSMVLLNNLFATVGAALSASFGSTITAMAGLISVQVPAVVSAVGTTLGMLAMPVAALLSLGADKLSNLWAQWAAGVPLMKPLLASGKSAQGRDYSWYTPLITVKSTTTPSAAPSQNPRPDIQFDKGRDTIYVYMENDSEKVEFVISPIALDLVTKNDHLATVSKKSGDEAERSYIAATSTDPTQRIGMYRLPTQKELSTAEVEVFLGSENAPDF